MTVEQLIKELVNYPPDMQVRFMYNYGDYTRTQVAAEIRCVEEGQVKHSDYHAMDKVVEDGGHEVVLLSASRIS